GDENPAILKPLAEFAIGMSMAIVKQVEAKQPRPPLGSAMSHDFPPRFCHMLVVDGVMHQRRWSDARLFQQASNMQQVVATFMDRFDDSFEKFDERLVLHQDGGTHHLRVQWNTDPALPTAGMAHMIDSTGTD